MLNGHENEIENFFLWYIEVKDILTCAETAELNGMVYFQPYNELRYALDHFMRAIGWWREQTSVPDDKKAKLDDDIRSALKSATGHLQRAYSDITEWYFITVREACVTTLKPYKTEQIVHAIPNYYSEIKPFLTGFEKQLNYYKENKSSEKNNLTDEETFDSILFGSGDFNKLKEILEKIQTAEPALVEMKIKEIEEEKEKEREEKEKEKEEEKEKEKEKKEENRKNIITSIIVPIITGVAGTILGGMITAMFL